MIDNYFRTTVIKMDEGERRTGAGMGCMKRRQSYSQETKIILRAEKHNNRMSSEQILVDGRKKL